MQQAVRDALIAFMAATARGCDGFLRYQNRLDLGQRDIGLLRRR
jgi:hypothetical protein